MHNYIRMTQLLMNWIIVHIELYSQNNLKDFKNIHVSVSPAQSSFKRFFKEPNPLLSLNHQ